MKCGLFSQKSFISLVRGVSALKQLGRKIFPDPLEQNPNSMLLDADTADSGPSAMRKQLCSVDQ